MASAQDRWLFLLAFAPLPLACADDAPQDPDEGSSSDTTAAPPSTNTGTMDADGSTTIVTTGVDGTSSSSDDGSTTAVDGSTTELTSASSSEGTTMSVEPGTSSSSEEGGSTTGEPQGLCEVWAEAQSMCYYYYYYGGNLEQYCYDYLLSVDLLCVPQAAQYYQCRATGCFVDCSTENEALDECNDLLLAQQLGCDMIPIVPSVGTTPMQCTGFIDVVELCTAGGYYIPFFSFYVNYEPYYAQYACVNGWVLADGQVPAGPGDSCGGAYEELLTCLSALPCGQLENAIFSGGGGPCEAQHEAVTCRCELGA